MKIGTLAVKTVRAVTHAVGGIGSTGTLLFKREGKALKKLAAVLFILLVPGLSIAGEEIVLKGATPGVTPESSALPDIFFEMAHICTTAVVDCLPSNVVNKPFVAYVRVYVPSTQVYTRYYLITDMQGAVVEVYVAVGTLSVGSNSLAVSNLTLPSGQIYRLSALFLGNDGKTTLSDPYTFKVL